jgi:hypothetical protein
VCLVLIGSSAALVGPELRYRFPQDPLIGMLACAAVLMLLKALASGARRRPQPATGEIGSLSRL